MRLLHRFLLFSLAIATLPVAFQAQPTPIRPGEPWLDDRGQQIQAHGGGIIQLGKTWFWFGEDRSQSNDPAKRYVSCYSSEDLTHWKFRRQVVAMTAPENLAGRW